MVHFVLFAIIAFAPLGISTQLCFVAILRIVAGAAPIGNFGVLKQTVAKRQFKLSLIIISNRLDEKHSTHSVIWPILLYKANEPNTEKALALGLLAQRGFLNIPGSQLITLGIKEGMQGIQLICKNTELENHGTLGGQPDWSIDQLN